MGSRVPRLPNFAFSRRSGTPVTRGGRGEDAPAKVEKGAGGKASFRMRPPEGLELRYCGKIRDVAP